MKKKILYVIPIILIILFCSLNFSYAKLNSNYASEENSMSADYETAIAESNAVSDFLIVIIEFVYALVVMAKDIIQAILKILTGIDAFPWADIVVFNAIPFLDVNFIAPSSGSLFGQTLFSDIIGNLYYTIITICIAILGIAVGILSIKLLITSIAKNKAEYQKAILKVCLTIILIFVAHYIISLIFYVNEQMVEMASGIFKNAAAESEYFGANGATGGKLLESVGKTFESKVYDDDDEFNPIMGLLYSILVVQSCMLFITYLRRLIYVIVIAIMAPIYIMFDLFKSL